MRLVKILKKHGMRDMILSVLYELFYADGREQICLTPTRTTGR